jgi:hypothetical protein
VILILRTNKSLNFQQMKKLFLLCCLVIVFVNVSLAQELKSPNGNFAMLFSLSGDGTPTYQLSYKGKVIIKPSALGLELKNDNKSLLNDFAVTDVKTSSHDSNWQPVWGEVKTIRDHYNELAITLNQKGTNRLLIIAFGCSMTDLAFAMNFPHNQTWSILSSKKSVPNLL